MERFNFINFVNEIIKFSPRQLEGEARTREFLVNLLDENNINYYLQGFKVDIPFTKRVELKADKKKIECDGCSMIGGKIEGKDTIISSLDPPSGYEEKPNLNFNPRCEAISNVEYYFAPSISVGHDGLKKILKAEKIEGEVEITNEKHEAFNILVGNLKNPEFVCFAHYDSIKKGAIDNAAGVSVLMGAILENPEMLENTLYVFSACEELSFEKPTYWGYGFRRFEDKYFDLLESAKKIFVIDSLGHSPTEIVDDMDTLHLGFPVENLNSWKDKIIFYAGDFDKLMTVYHSDLDDGRYLKEKYLREAKNKLINSF